MKAIGYIRVSTEEQAREEISLENQRAKIEAYCALNELELVKLIEDAGKSGKDLNREGMQTLVSLVKAHSIDAVVVYKLDRLSRRERDTLSLMDLIEKKSIASHSITERIDTKSAMGAPLARVNGSQHLKAGSMKHHKTVVHRSVIDRRQDQCISQEPEMKDSKEIFGRMTDAEKPRTISYPRRQHENENPICVLSRL